jgi:hypothetical protein
VPLQSVIPGELPSKEGRSVLAALQRVINADTVFPVSLRTVLAAATDVDGAERKAIARLIGSIARALSQAAGSGTVNELVQAVRDKKTLQELINRSGQQLASGKLDVPALEAVFAALPPTERLESAAELVADGIPAEPSGLSLEDHFKRIHEATGGLFGLWAIGGEPGLGKTTFCWQLSLIAARAMPVLYYDLDGTGTAALLRWTYLICGKRSNKMRKALKDVHLRDSIRTLGADLHSLSRPSLVVIDSFQTLPTLANHRRTSLDDWLVQFKGLIKQGHTVLITSEKNRAAYGHVGLGDFKETGEIEYAASLGAHLSGDPLEEDEPVTFTIVKNRHRNRKGQVTELARDEAHGGHWFKEI